MTQSSNHMVDAEVEFTLRNGERLKLHVKEIPYTWDWYGSEMSRDATELWAVISYVSDNFIDYIDFAVLSMVSTSAIKDVDTTTELL